MVRLDAGGARRLLESGGAALAAVGMCSGRPPWRPGDAISADMPRTASVPKTCRAGGGLALHTCYAVATAGFRRLDLIRSAMSPATRFPESNMPPKIGPMRGPPNAAHTLIPATHRPG